MPEISTHEHPDFISVDFFCLRCLCDDQRGIIEFYFDGYTGGNACSTRRMRSNVLCHPFTAMIWKCQKNPLTNNKMWPNIIIAAWASAAFTIYWLEFFRGPKVFPFLNFKPINCECCLSVWMFVVFAVLYHYFPAYVPYIAGAFSTGIITPLLLKLIRK